MNKYGEAEATWAWLPLMCVAVLVGGWHAQTAAASELQVGTLTATNMIRQTVATGTNYFMGNVGVGTTSPGAALEVVGELVTSKLVVGTGTASGASSVAEGGGTDASGDYAHAEGYGSLASGDYAHAEGRQTVASDIYNHAEGFASVASGYAGAHAEGCNTDATGSAGAHSEGSVTLASGGSGAHAEGQLTDAAGDYGAHAEGYHTDATGDLGAHAEGFSTEAAGDRGAHAEGHYTHAAGDFGAHAEGDHTLASGSYGAHAGGSYAQATHNRCFIWSDGGAGGTMIVGSTTNNQFTVHAVNGIRLLGGVTEVVPAGDLAMGIYTNRP